MNNPHLNPVTEFRPLLRCEFGAIICLLCDECGGFPSKRIARHFSSSDKHTLPKSLYDPILQVLPHHRLAQDWDDLRRPPHGSAPIEGLQVMSGWLCTRCDLRTTGEDVARQHLKC